MTTWRLVCIKVCHHGHFKHADYLSTPNLSVILGRRRQVDQLWLNVTAQG